MSSENLQAAQGRMSEQWHSMDWAKCWRKVRSLQRRLVKSLREGNWRKVKRLRYLLTHSFSARAVAVKQVSTNKGKNTAGIDGKKWKTPGQKMQAVYDIAQWNGYHALPLKRVYVPKKGGRWRPLGIPTMEDRARQALHALFLKPIAETRGDTNSYGFRDKRRCADAIDQIFKILRQRGSACWILEADIKGFFDHIAFDWILENIPLNKKVLRAWLNSGFMEKRQLFPTTQGVPQGGIISPIIANRVLDGLEKHLLGSTWHQRKYKLHFVRYADDFIVVACSEEILRDEILPKINAFLHQRGVELSTEKTRITHISEGFNFLGQTIRKYQHQDNKLGKIQITPSEQALQAVKDKVKDICQSSGSLTQAQLIDRLNPVLRGWGNYHRHVICSRKFTQLDSYVWFRLSRWAKRRHPNQTGKWIADRYFGAKDTRQWLFRDKRSGKSLIRVAQSIKHLRHIKIKGDANPFDIEWKAYFEKRDLQLKMSSINQYLGKVLKQQSGVCPVCRQALTIDEKHHLEHKEGNEANKGLNNVWLVHHYCRSHFQYELIAA